ncbi:DUF3352 domain-containing protein [Patescibacteria group bacterium]|nr:DUF3352 domain-containing protein [Patescibacteria group bacterium]
MRNSSYFKRFIAVGLFFVLIFTLTGCGSPDKAEVAASSKSKTGIALEDFLPQDTLMFFSINTQDKTQRENFLRLLSYFPQEDITKLMEEGFSEMNKELAQTGLSYEEDFKPIISDNFMAIMGLAGDLNQDEPDIYVAFTIADIEKANALLELMSEDEGMEIGNLWGYKTLDDTAEDMYVVLYEDTILVTNIKENREEAVKRVKDNKESLLSNENYKNTLASIETPNLGIGYINVESLFANIQDSESALLGSDLVTALLSETFVFIAQKEGIQMNVHVGFDEDSKTFNLADLPYENPYMYKELPGDKLLMYAEAYNLQQLVKLELDMLLATETDKEDWEDTQDMFKKTVGLDLEQDILSWMDNGYAFSMQRNGSVMPGISIYIDAKSNPDGAQKLVDLIDAGLLQGIEMMKMNATNEDVNFDEILKHEIVQLGENPGNTLTRVSLDFTGLTEAQLADANLPAGVFTEPFELYYGITANNYFVISTYAGLDKAWDNELTVAENEMIKDAQTHLKNYPYQLSYFSIDETVLYIDQFIEFMKISGNEMPEDFNAAYAKAKTYLAPIKYIIGGNKKVENIAEGMVFIKLAEVEKTVETEIEK